MTLLRALLEGFGWKVGKRVAEEAIREALEGEPEPPAPTEEDLARAAKARARAEEERAKAAVAARHAAEKKAKEDAKAVERELAELKKRIKR